MSVILISLPQYRAGVPRSFSGSISAARACARSLREATRGTSWLLDSGASLRSDRNE